MSFFRPDSSSLLQHGIFYNIRLTTGSIDSRLELDGKAVPESPRSARPVSLSIDGLSSKKLRKARHFLVQKAGIRHTGGPRELLPVARESAWSRAGENCVRNRRWALPTIFRPSPSARISTEI